MKWVYLQIKQNNFLSPQPSNPYSDTDGLDLEKKVSPGILLAIIILAIIFFISGLLHLLVRYLLRPPIREQEDMEIVTSFQGQLQQLFHLHDAGVDQSFIDTLPLFQYKAIIGIKSPFDCAVCLCEFGLEDKLRLLPKCSHAFHMECIDTWLLSHSTCPLCRANLLLDFSPNNSCSPIVVVLESGRESSREIGVDIGTTSSGFGSNSHLGFQGDTELGDLSFDFSTKKIETQVPKRDDHEKKIVHVKLGKFRSVDIGEGSSNNGNGANSRRCFSMGSFEYVMDENTLLQVPIRTPMKKPSSKRPHLPLVPGHKQAMSECDCESARDFEAFKGVATNASSNARDCMIGSFGKVANGRPETESFSISKIWLRREKEKQKGNDHRDLARRAFSFRFGMNTSDNANDNLEGKNGNGIGSLENGCEVGNHSFNSMDSQFKSASFARRTLLWLVGRQNKVVQSPIPSTTFP